MGPDTQLSSAWESHHAPFLPHKTVQAHSCAGFRPPVRRHGGGVFLTVGPDVVDLSGVWSLFVILAVLLLIVALFFVK